jgi:carbamoyltransferase
MKNLVSIFAGHDASVSFWNASTNKFYTIEIERLVKKRYFRLHEDNDHLYQRTILEKCRDIAEEYWGIENDYECVLISSDGYIQPPATLRQVFNTQDVKTIARHHDTHAASAFYQSPFKQALIFSYDGGGDDGHMNVYTANSDGVKFLENITSDFGGGYLIFGSLIREVAESSRSQLALAGKMMGLCGYGKIIDEYVPAFKQFLFDRNYRQLAESTGLPLKNLDNQWENPLENWVFEGQEGYDIAATAQAAFEYAVFELLDKYDPNIPLILTGGCALNVLVNEKIKCLYNRPVYVPPNPHDGGLSLGHIFLALNEELDLYPNGDKLKPSNVNITYSGLPLLGSRAGLNFFATKYNAKKVNKKEIAQLIKDGKILGLVYGDSEVGPRALGNRSIVCDPNIADMKDILNSKVKFREWYRPFAPFCKKEDAHKYFESRNFDNLEYMSYAPMVKGEYREKLPAITHVDGSARLQTVTEESHSHFYELLTEFGKISETNVLLNTSFNIRGYPILSTIEDALYALNKTDMDYVVIEDYLFGKLK